MKKTILKTLDQVERTERVRILLAVESGSRAWGFASTNSDWDVRFIYLRTPEWYLSVQRRRDVLEFPISDSLDVSGWDLRKTLGLFAKSNPPLFEWLRSPMVYREAYSTTADLRRLSGEFFSSRSCLYHYLHMAQGNFREYLQGPRVRTKKYFYVLRPILACRWIETHHVMPPMEFDKLVRDQLPEHLRPIVADLLRRKRAGEELADGPNVPEINAFLDLEINRLSTDLPQKASRRPVNWEALDGVFRESLNEVWKSMSSTILGHALKRKKAMRLTPQSLHE